MVIMCRFEKYSKIVEIATSKYMQVSHRIPSRQVVAVLAFGAVSAVRRPAGGLFFKHNTKRQLYQLLS